MTGQEQESSGKDRRDATHALVLAKKGDEEALKTLLERERPLLYDYLMRMTGQMQRSLDTVDEVFLTMNAKVIQDVGKAADLRAKLIKTVRKFSLDIWNADTGVLENAGVLAMTEASNRRGKTAPTTASQKSFDRAFRSLPGPEREVLWLTWNLGWDDQAIAESTFRTAVEVDHIREQAILALKALSPMLASQSMGALGALQRPHPVVLQGTQVTIELSQVMRGIRERPVRLWSWGRLIFLGVLFMVGLAFYFERQSIENLLQTLIREPSRRNSAQ